MDVLLRLEADESALNIGKAQNLPVSTVCAIRAIVAKTSRTRSGVMEKCGSKI
jgi:hypothetical protein